jgi:hypothetical protein
MSWIQFQNDRKVLNGDLNFVQLFIGTADNVVCSNIMAINVEQPIGVVDSFLEHLLLHKGSGPYKECLLVVGVQT